MNKALLDTDILSEVSKGINAAVVGNAQTYRKARGFLTLSVLSVMEAIQGYQGITASRHSATPLLRKKSCYSTRMTPTWPAKSLVIWIASVALLVVATRWLPPSPSPTASS